MIPAQEKALEAPESSDESICGAGYITFTATSSIADDNLEFEWYESFDGQLQFLGSLNGAIGRTQFITSFLISDREYAVRVKLGSLVSPFTTVRAEVLNEASIVQQPEIQLCGEAYLEVETNMDSIASYQWQILVPNESGQSFFQNVTTESSDSVVLIAVETGFYRAIVTDSTGCHAVSSEVEVTSDPVVDFINSIIRCYDPAEIDSDLVTLESEYGRPFTTFQWEESLDSINFVTIANSQGVLVNKPTAQPFDTAYYRLTITEQNCSNDTIIGVYWRPFPEGTISHADPLIDMDDFFFCDEDAEADRTLRITSTAPNTQVSWFSVNYIEGVPLTVLKGFSGPTGIDGYLTLKESLEVEVDENFLDFGDEVVLEQKDGNHLQVDGGLVFAAVVDTISGCGTFTNGIFADTAFPFPLFGSKLAYIYELGTNSVAGCVGESLEFTSYDQTADAYSWLEYDPVGDTYTEVDNDAVFNVTLDEGFSRTTYFLEVTKNGCTGLSEGFDVTAVGPPTVEITNFDGEAVACDEIPSILIVGEGSSDVVDYQWYYSMDDVNYVLAPGDSAKHFYSATLNGYYKLEGSNPFCTVETEPVRVEIPNATAPDFVEVALDGEVSYCEGDEMTITCNYSGTDVGYFWYYSFFELDGDDLSLELVELGGTSSPEITLDTRIFGEDLLEPMVVYFYVLVIDGACVTGSTNIPFVATINPSPSIEILFSDNAIATETLICEEQVISEQVEVNNLATAGIPGITYLWTRYNPEVGDYDTIPGATSTTFTITEPGRYRSVASTSNDACFSISNDLDVLVLPSQVSGDTLYCDGNVISLQAEEGFIPDLSVYSYQWFYGTDGNEFDDLPGENAFNLNIEPTSSIYGPGSFYFEATYNSCTVTSDTIRVSENINSFGSTFSVGSSQVKGVPFEASVSLEIDLEGVVFDWQPSEFVSFVSSTSAVFNFPETYAQESALVQLTISSPDGCEVFYEQLITFDENTPLSFSKFITPNGDGLNDVFMILGLDREQSNRLEIMDSWGNRLFSYSNYYNGFQESASLVESLKSEGIYYYIFSTEEQVLKGSFYLKN